MLDPKVRLLSQLFFMNAQAMMPKLKVQYLGKGKLCFLVSCSQLLVWWCQHSASSQSGEWMRGVQTQDRQPVEKPLSSHVPADVNSSLFLETAGCSLPSSALAAHWPCSHRFSLFTWKQGARRRKVLLWAHSTAAQPEEQDKEWLYIQRAACPVHLTMC